MTLVSRICFGVKLSIRDSLIADVQTPTQAIEVETESTIADAGRQLAGFRKSVYVAGATEKATKLALEHYKDSTIGVMDPNGEIVKPSTRKRK